MLTINWGNEYCEWIATCIIEKCTQKIPPSTFYRYRMLATFTDDLEVAERIGKTLPAKIPRLTFSRSHSSSTRGVHKMLKELEIRRAQI